MCISNSTTGLPFISTLELRQFNGSVYLTPYEEQFFLSVSARISFGAENEDPIRYDLCHSLTLRVKPSPILSKFDMDSSNV